MSERGSSSSGTDLQEPSSSSRSSHSGLSRLPQTLNVWAAQMGCFAMGCLTYALVQDKLSEAAFLGLFGSLCLPAGTGALYAIRKLRERRGP